MSTAQQIIKDALDNVGVTNYTPEKLNKALRTLNNLLSIWSIEKLLVYYNVDESFTLTPATNEYTFGTGGTFNSARPVMIDYAYIQDASGNDYPIKVISEKEYKRIFLKTVSNRPCELFLKTEYPLAKVFLYPTPNLAETLYLSSQKPLASVASIDSTINLPAEYSLALEHELSRLLAPKYNFTLDSNFFDMANKSKAAIKSLRSEPIPDVEFDAFLAHSYNYDRYDITQG